MILWRNTLQYRSHPIVYKMNYVVRIVILSISQVVKGRILLLVHIVFDLRSSTNIIIFNINTLYHSGALIIGYFVYLLSFYSCRHLLHIHMHTHKLSTQPWFFIMLQFICIKRYALFTNKSFFFLCNNFTWRRFYDTA